MDKAPVRRGFFSVRGRLRLVRMAYDATVDAFFAYIHKKNGF
jgi:hypothetical protein